MKRRAPGFTLLELMVVVCIISVLASVAIPEFNQLQLRSTIRTTPAPGRTWSSTTTRVPSPAR